MAAYAYNSKSKVSDAGQRAIWTEGNALASANGGKRQTLLAALNALLATGGISPADAQAAAAEHGLSSGLNLGAVLTQAVSAVGVEASTIASNPGDVANIVVGSAEVGAGAVTGNKGLVSQGANTYASGEQDLGTKLVSNLNAAGDTGIAAGYQQGLNLLNAGLAAVGVGKPKAKASAAAAPAAQWWTPIAKWLGW